MRICVDIDGTLCELRRPGETYADIAPRPLAIARLKAWRDEGHVIILLTARHMKTTGGNVGQVIARQGRTLFDWLDKHDVPYDELWFGKPWADIYIDDNGLRFEGDWGDLPASAEDLPQSKEKAMESL